MDFACIVGIVIGVIVASILWAIALGIERRSNDKELKQLFGDAAKAGVGRYVVDPATGDAVWEWMKLESTEKD